MIIDYERHNRNHAEATEKIALEIFRLLQLQGVYHPADLLDDLKSKSQAEQIVTSFYEAEASYFSEFPYNVPTSDKTDDFVMKLIDDLFTYHIIDRLLDRRIYLVKTEDGSPITEETIRKFARRSLKRS